MTHAMIFDAIRTPRGKGKKDGSLHEVKPVDLLARRADANCSSATTSTPAQVDDVVMGVVSPIGEQGSVIAKVAALKAGWDFRCRRRAAQPLLRVRPRGGQHGGAEGALAAGKTWSSPAASRA